jgi:aspartate ammonia-lyase
MVDIRREKDIIGFRNIPVDALWGIHTQRALENFPLINRPVNPALIHAFGAVKLAAIQTNQSIRKWSENVVQALVRTAHELMEGLLDEHIIVDALQGGAGTSTNMNVNEVIANRALQILGEKPGNYAVIHPIDDVNLHQSTNDTYPTALKVASIQLIRELEQELVGLTESFQIKEKEFANVVKIGRTQMQDAVLTTLGREMSAYADAFARDRWRTYKCEERLRVVNLGGTAIGTGISAPKQYIFNVVEHLKEITGIGLARSENLVEATQNADVYVEVSGILNACATTLFKSANDLRLLSSGPSGGFGEIILPRRQAGSSIMPGKVNPVIPEAVMQACMQVFANSQAITAAASQGNLELNAFLPLIAENLLQNIGLLANALHIFRIHCVDGLQADEERCRKNVESSSALLTALVEEIGYEKASEVAETARETGQSIKDIVLESRLLTETKYLELVSPEHVNRLGSKRERKSSL